MPHPIVPVGISLGGTALGTSLAEGLKSPKAIAIFYVEVAKSCYKATG
jgi:predicted alpha/beta-fold hydrolase